MLFRKLNILFLTNAHNSMSQRAWLELTKQHRISIELATSPQAMLTAKERLRPDLIVCPLLTSRVPEEIYTDKKVPCLIVHPGVQGDRGMSSIDWALKRKLNNWGVTVLQAEKEMDAGDIWSSTTFPIQRQDNRTITKSSLYKNEIIETAMSCLMESINNFHNNILPKPLDYSAKDTIGQLNSNMTQKDRQITWDSDVDDIVNNIRFSDSQPGVKIQLHGKKFFAYNAFAEHCYIPESTTYGNIVGHRDGAIAVTARHGLVWIATLKSTVNKIKLPATLALPAHIINSLDILNKPAVELDQFHSPLSLPSNGFQEIWTCTQNDISYVHFNFTNGACSTDQCKRLEDILSRISKDKYIKGVVLVGGYDTFSNGIHLNVIENAYDPFQESVQNINAIDDVIKVIACMNDKITISALQGSAGAGGVMMAAAADHVITHRNTVLNPHYKLMGLYGSEYWTHFLPNRVGKERAIKLTESKLPLLSEQAKDIHLVDTLLGRNVEEFRGKLVEKVESMVHDNTFFNKIISMKKRRNTEWYVLIEQSRKNELNIMHKNFQGTEYNFARTQFVKRHKPVSSPSHLPGFQSREIDVTVVKNKLLSEVKGKVDEITKYGNEAPGLCILTDEKDNCFTSVLQDKLDSCKKTGIRYIIPCINSEHPKEMEKCLLKYIREANNNENIDGIFVQQSSMQQIHMRKIMGHISQNKQMERFSNTNGSSLSEAIIRMLLEYGMQLFEKTVLVISEDKTDSLPIINHMSSEGTSVVLAHPKQDNLKEFLQSADIVIATNGIPSHVNGKWMKKGSAVINLGNGDNYKLDHTNCNASLFINFSDSVECLTFSIVLNNLVKSKWDGIKASHEVLHHDVMNVL